MTNNSNRYLCMAVLAAAFVVASYIPAKAESAPLPPERFGPVKVAEGVPGRPGTVAWSPDGRRLAYIGETVEIYDISTGKKSSVKADAPFFVAWEDELNLLLLHGDGTLILVDAESLKTTVIQTPQNAVAAYPAWGRKRLVVLTAWSKEMSIGVEVGHGIHIIDRSDNSITEVSSNTTILPRRYSGSEYIKGWMSAGPNPVSGEAALVKLIVPPNAPPYIKVVLWDALTGTNREPISRYRGGLLKPWGSWSPLGNRAALVDDNGRLRVLSLKGEAVGVDDEISGMYPAWDSGGGRIFFGGYLIDEDGGSRTPVVPGAAGSAGFFSPRGERMALASDNNLWLLSNIEPSTKASGVTASLLREKATLLKELFMEGFITEGEYFERLTAIMNR